MVGCTGPAQGAHGASERLATQPVLTTSAPVQRLSVTASFCLEPCRKDAFGFSVLSYTVTRRTQEIGVRMALGARPRDLNRMVIGDGSRIVLAGVAIGAAAAVMVGRLVTTLLAGVSASDPITLVAVGAALLVVALAASYIPARRASRIDPATALRTE